MSYEYTPYIGLTVDQLQEELKERDKRIDELCTLCAEAYVVLGAFIDQLPNEKILDNLAAQKMIHTDVLPFYLEEK